MNAINWFVQWFINGILYFNWFYNFSVVKGEISWRSAAQRINDKLYQTNSGTITRGSQQQTESVSQQSAESTNGRFGRQLQINDFFCSVMVCRKASLCESTPNTNAISPDNDRWCRLYWRRECKRQAAEKHKIDSECVSVVNQLWKFEFFFIVFIAASRNHLRRRENVQREKILPNMKMDWIQNEL